MRIPLAFVSLTLASGALSASDYQGDYNWVQIQAGITDHRTQNSQRVQPAFGLGVGTWLNGNWGLEASVLGTYVDYGYGKAKEAHADGSVLFNPFPTPANIRPFLRLGLGSTTIGTPVSDIDRHTTRLNGVAGLGAQVLCGDRMFFSLEGRLVEIETQATRKEAQALAGFGLRWGSHQSTVAAFTPPPVEAPAPAPVEAPAPAPVLVVVPVATATQQYCTILDLQFDINKDAIQREDIEKLAVVGTFMTKYPNTTAVIEGHADNVGAADHNMKLSQARAQSVVTYLTDTIHIDPSRLSAVGFGDTRPIADNSTEDGKRQNRRIDAVIACVTDVAGLPVAPARVTMALFIDFDQNKAEVKPEYDGPLGKVADFLKANPTVTASVEGHTGNLQTTPALAMEISRRRAQNVVNYLVDHFGIDRSRLKAQGFGDNRRFAYNTSAEGEQENRRVNLIFNYAK
jgi:OOP family OmpA-OmpF porin